MVPFLAALPMVASVKEPRPAILIFSHAGNIIAWRPEDFDKFAHFGLEVAVWETGRIVWGRVEKKPNGRLHRQCYEATISPARVAEALRAFEGRGVFKAQAIDDRVVCGGWTDLVVRSKAQSLHWFSWGTPDL